MQKKYNNKKPAYKNTLINLNLNEKRLLVKFLCDESGMIRINYQFNKYHEELLVAIDFLTAKEIICSVKDTYTSNEYFSEIYKIDKIYFEIMQENKKEIFYEDEFKKYFIEEKES